MRLSVVVASALGVCAMAMATNCARFNSTRASAESVDASAASSPRPAADAASDAVVASAARSSTPGSASGAGEKPLLGWTDPRAVALLVENCNFQIPDDTRQLAERMGLPDTGPTGGALASITCGGIYEQSCVPDPCDRESCREECGVSCNDCSKPCAATCQSCKSECKDDACRLRCAEATAKCRSECVAAGDRCVSGTCGKRYDTCTKTFWAKFEKLGCKAPCSKLRKCATCSDETAQTPFCKSCPSFEPPERCRDLCTFFEAW